MSVMEITTCTELTAKLTFVCTLMSLYCSEIFFCTATIIQNTTIHRVLISESVLLKCCYDKSNWKDWKFYDNFINLNNFIIDEKFEKRSILFPNFSVVVNDILLSHEGVYTCLSRSDSTIYARHFLEINGM